MAAVAEIAELCPQKINKKYKVKEDTIDIKIYLLLLCILLTEPNWCVNNLSYFQLVWNKKDCNIKCLEEKKATNSEKLVANNTNLGEQSLLQFQLAYSGHRLIQQFEMLNELVY